MSEQKQPQQPPMHIDPETGPGAYATGLAVIHTQEEFMLDFINGISAPAQAVARVVVSPLQMKRISQVLQDNIKHYQKTHGTIPVKAAEASSKNQSAGDLYSQLQVPAGVLGGTYSNVMSVKYTRDIFILDFMTKFPPNAKLVARLLISAPQILSIGNAISDNIAQYEKRHGAVKESQSADQSMGFSLN